MKATVGRPPKEAGKKLSEVVSVKIHPHVAAAMRAIAEDKELPTSAIYREAVKRFLAKQPTS